MFEKIRDWKIIPGFRAWKHLYYGTIKVFLLGMIISCLNLLPSVLDIKTKTKKKKKKSFL